MCYAHLTVYDIGKSILVNGRNGKYVYTAVIAPDIKV